MTEETQEKYRPQIRDILVWPDAGLTKESERVTEFDDNLRMLAADMFATIGVLDGIGLAAPQIGVHKAVIVLRIESDKPIIIVNPTVTVLSQEMFKWEEGCLSVPGYFKKRERPNDIALRFQDTEGVEHHVHFSGLYAFAVQHEVDHLYGKCFVDGMSKLWHPNIKKKIRKQRSKNEERIARIRLALMSDGGHA